MNRALNDSESTDQRTQILEFTKPLYYVYEKTANGVLSQLALEAGDWRFEAVHQNDSTYRINHENGLTFLADLTEGKQSKKGTYKIKGCVEYIGAKTSFFDDVNIDGTGNSGESLRPAQTGAIYSLLSHWSLTNDVATIVLL